MTTMTRSEASVAVPSVVEYEWYSSTVTFTTAAAAASPLRAVVRYASNDSLNFGTDQKIEITLAPTAMHSASRPMRWRPRLGEIDVAFCSNTIMRKTGMRIHCARIVRSKTLCARNPAINVRPSSGSAARNPSYPSRESDIPRAVGKIALAASPPHNATANHAVSASQYPISMMRVTVFG